jgi:hypothetical protein
LELVEVEVVGLEQTERILEVGARIVLQAAVGFAGQKALVAIGLERHTQPLLRVAVAGRDIEIVDAAVDGFGDDVGGGARLFIHDHNAAEADEGKMLAGLAQRAASNGPGGSFGV